VSSRHFGWRSHLRWLRQELRSGIGLPDNGNPVTRRKPCGSPSGSHNTMNRTWAAAAFPSVIGGPDSDSLTASAVSSTTRRLVMLRFRERFAFRFGSDHVANLSQHLNARREWVAIIINDPAKLPFESGGLFIG
jgi:hypothetical protein